MRAFLILAIISWALPGCGAFDNQYSRWQLECQLEPKADERIYQALLPGGLRLSVEQQKSLEILYMDSEKRQFSTKVNAMSCFTIPPEARELQVFLDSEPGYFTRLDSLSSSFGIQQLNLEPLGQIDLELRCPRGGYRANEVLTPNIAVRKQMGDLSSLQIEIEVVGSDETIAKNFPLKPLYSEDLTLSSTLDLTDLTEGVYALRMKSSRWVETRNQKTNLQQTDCNLAVVRTCENPNDFLDTNDLRCKPKVCDGIYTIGMEWVEDLPKGRGTASFSCVLENGIAIRKQNRFSCKDGYFHTDEGCIGARQLSAYDNASCALLENDEIKCWGEVSLDLFKWEKEGNGDYFIIRPENSIRFGEPVKSIVGECAVLKSGRVKCWNQNGQITEVTTSQSNPLEEVETLSQRTPVFCGTYRNGDTECWGDTTTPVHAYDDVQRQTVPTGVGNPRLTSFTKIKTGTSLACGLKDDSQLYCWGGNSFETNPAERVQFSSVRTPRLIVSADHIVDYTFNDVVICIVTADGEVFCQGGNNTGNLGVPISEASGPVFKLTKVKALDSPAQSIFSSNFNVCAILKSGQITCWGTNEYGQVGSLSEDSFIFQPEFVKNKSGETIGGFVSGTGGLFHNCALTLSGQVWCWGDNAYGAVGDNSGGRGSDDEDVRNRFAAPIRAVVRPKTR
jgi:alpha-tubulin suppressor-like RCC1 family protein